MPYGNSYDSGNPLDSSLAKLLGAQIRTLKAALKERFDDIFGTSGADSIDTADPYRPLLIKFKSGIQAKVIPGNGGIVVRNAADNQDNLVVSDIGNAAVRTDLNVGGTLTVTGPSVHTGNATFSALASFSAGINVTGGFNMVSGSITLNGASISSTTGAATFGGVLTCNSGISVPTGNLTLTGGDLSVGGNAVVIGNVTGNFKVTGNFANVQKDLGTTAGGTFNFDGSQGNHQVITALSAAGNITFATASNLIVGAKYRLRVDAQGSAYAARVTLSFCSGTHTYVDQNNTATTGWGNFVECGTNTLAVNGMLLFEFYAITTTTAKLCGPPVRIT